MAVDPSSISISYTFVVRSYDSCINTFVSEKPHNLNNIIQRVVNMGSNIYKIRVLEMYVQKR